MIDILLMVIIISLWCCGFRAITGEGMILYFLRQPFESNDNGIMNIFKARLEAIEIDEGLLYTDVPVSGLPKEEHNRRQTEITLDAKRARNKLKDISSTVAYIMKPFILCVTCMSSIHGTFIYWWIAPVFDPQVWLISIIAAAFVNSILWMSFEKLSE